MKDYMEERAVNIANYIIEHNTTVWQTAKTFGVSKVDTCGSNNKERFIWAIE